MDIARSKKTYYVQYQSYLTNKSILPAKNIVQDHQFGFRPHLFLNGSKYLYVHIHINSMLYEKSDELKKNLKC